MRRNLPTQPPISPSTDIAERAMALSDFITETAKYYGATPDYSQPYFADAWSDQIRRHYSDGDHIMVCLKNVSKEKEQDIKFFFDELEAIRTFVPPIKVHSEQQENGRYTILIDVTGGVKGEIKNIKGGVRNIDKFNEVISYFRQENERAEEQAGDVKTKDAPRISRRELLERLMKGGIGVGGLVSGVAIAGLGGKQVRDSYRPDIDIATQRQLARQGTDNMVAGGTLVMTTALLESGVMERIRKMPKPERVFFEAARKQLGEMEAHSHGCAR